MAARWLDIAFFSALGGMCLYIAGNSFTLAACLSLAMVLLQVLLDQKRWGKYQRQLWQKAKDRLKRENWLRREGEHLRNAGGIILYPTPDEDRLMGMCLRWGPGTKFHCFGEERKVLADLASSMGCTVTFHVWDHGGEPSPEQVAERIRLDAPIRRHQLMPRLRRLPFDRYLLTGSLLLILSIFLKRAFYWRLLGSMCLMIGAFRRSFQRIGET